ncbi:hypothetical protein CBLAS_0824 [Campylobacter blaseri]|nr:hypothetical protein CBLAS_0824 [Campylobacter blaseri]
MEQQLQSIKKFVYDSRNYEMKNYKKIKYKNIKRILHIKRNRNTKDKKLRYKYQQ